MTVDQFSKQRTTIRALAENFAEIAANERHRPPVHRLTMQGIVGKGSSGGRRRE